MPQHVGINKTLKILFATAAIVVIADQVLKAVIAQSLGVNEVVEVIPGFFNIVHFKNPGAAFGIFSSASALRKIFLIAVSVAALVIVGVLLLQSKNAWTSFSLSLIAGGAVGNLIDRVRFGSVVDFLDFYIGPYHWPAFNVADSAITVGVIATLFSYYLADGKERR